MVPSVAFSGYGFVPLLPGARMATPMWQELSGVGILQRLGSERASSRLLSPGSSTSFYLLTDSSNNVTGCTYGITYEACALPNPLPKLTSPVTKSVTIKILTVGNLTGLPPVTSAELAPIVTMLLYIVSDYSSTQLPAQSPTPPHNP